MQLGDKDIDKLFQDNLGDQLSPMDESAWEQVQPALQKRAAAKGVKWFWIPEVTLILIGLFCFLVPCENSLITKKEAGKGKSIELAESATTVKKMDELLGTKEDQANSRDRNELPTENEVRNETYIKAQKELNISRPVGTNETKSSFTEDGVEGVFNNSNQVINQNENLEMKSEELEKGEINQDKNPIKVFLFNSEKNAAKEEKVVESRGPYSPIGQNLKMSLFFLNTNALTEMGLPNFVQLKKDSVIPEVEKVLWSLGAHAGLNQMIGSSNFRINQGAYNLETKIESNLLFGFTGKAEYKKFGFSLGIELQQYSFTETLNGMEEEIVLDTQYRLISKEREIDGRNYWVIQEEINSTVQQVDVQYYNSQMSSSTFLQLPVQLSYRLKAFKNLSVVPSIGGRFNIPISTNGLKFNLGSNTQEKLKLSDVGSSINLLAGLGLEYSIAQKWSIGAQSRYIGGIQVFNSLNQDLQTDALQHLVVLRYHFGR